MRVADFYTASQRKSSRLWVNSELCLLPTTCAAFGQRTTSRSAAAPYSPPCSPPARRWPTYGQPGAGGELAGMPAKANLGRTAHICDPGGRQNISQIQMVVSLGAPGCAEGRGATPLCPSARRGASLCSGAAAIRRRRRICRHAVADLAA